MDLITSKQNPLVKKLASYKQKKFRDMDNKFIAVGDKLISEITEDWEVDTWVVSESRQNDFETEEKIVLADHLFSFVSQQKSPQGVLAVLNKRYNQLHDLDVLKNSFYIYIEEMQDPGNLGAILRLAHSAGASGVITSHNACDIYHPKVLASSAGSIFHIPVVENVSLEELESWLHSYEIQFLSLAFENATSLYETELTKRYCIAVGNEGHGLSEKALAISNKNIFIPMLGKAESLNASMALAIAVYEGVRQRLENK